MPGVAEVLALFWQSPMYLCTFANNMKVRARPKDIEPYNHTHDLEELKQSDLDAIQSRRMISRAQQLLARQRPTRLIALPSYKRGNKADMCGTLAHVCFVPIADIAAMFRRAANWSSCGATLLSA